MVKDAQDAADAKADAKAARAEAKAERDDATAEREADEARAAKEPSHVQQARNEIEIGTRTGNTDLVMSGRKRLEAAGIDGETAVSEAQAAYDAENSPKGKAAAARERRAAVQAEVDEAKAAATARDDKAADAAGDDATTGGAPGKGTPPEGRTAKPHETT